MTKNKEKPNEKQPRIIPGMRSDLKPQPKEDPDFGAGMEYESGDMNPDFTEADAIREHWKSRKSPQRKQTDRAKKRKVA